MTSAESASVTDYRINREIGKGNIGIVYHATQVNIGRDVALKLLKPELADNQEFIDRFLKEARLAARLNHPNIVRAIDAGCTPDGEYFFAMELIDGISLEDERLRRQKLPLDELLPLMLQIARAMEYAWESNRIIHGDIKPENIMLTGENRVVKIADLGLAQVAGSAASGSVMATPMYAAPEIIARKQQLIGPQSDIYSFGVMLYELATGRPPYDGELNELLQQHLGGITRSLRELCPLPDNSLSDFVTQMLEKEPQYRPASWREVVQFLTDYQEKYFSKNVPSLPPEKRSVFIWSGVAVSAAVIIAGVCIFLHSSRKTDSAADYAEIIKPLSPVTEKTQPVRTQPIAQNNRRKPVYVMPEPVEQKPEPTVKKEEPVEQKPEPAVKKEEPVEQKPEPTVKKEEPVEQKPEPTAPKPIQSVPAKEKPPRGTKKPIRRVPQPFVQHNKLSERIEFQTYRANMIRVLQKLDNNYSADWKNKALHTAIQAYHLQKELLPPRMPPVQVSAIRPTGFRQATWEVQSKQSGRIVISSDTDPRRIAEAIGHGVFEKLVQEGFIRRYKAKDFAEFFGYFLFHEALTSKRLLQNNYFYECTEGNKNVFIRKLHNKRFR